MGKTDISAIVRAVFPAIAIHEYLSRNGRDLVRLNGMRRQRLDNGYFYRPKKVFNYRS